MREGGGESVREGGGECESVRGGGGGGGGECERGDRT